MVSSKVTPQIGHWSGENGNAYVDRNPQSIEEMQDLYHKDYNLTRSAMNEEFLGTLNRDISILEVGANVGTQLEFLHNQGFSRLLGVDINKHAVTEAKRLRPQVTVIEASGFDLPFKDNFFDLVYTSGVLIHISPKDVQDIMKEMYRVSQRYIWGFEYYAPEYTEVLYRGKKNLLWKTDFAALFAETFSDLALVKEKKYPMTDGVNTSQMYLLEKVH